MVSVATLLLVLLGYYLWQRSRYDREDAGEAHGRALADAAAIGAIVVSITLAGILADREGLNHASVTLIGAVIGAIVSGPVRRAVLVVQRIDPRGVR